jgi:hypothetical protein
MPSPASAFAPSAASPSAAAAAEEVGEEVLRQSVGDLRCAKKREERAEAPLAREKGKG